MDLLLSVWCLSLFCILPCSVVICRLTGFQGLCGHFLVFALSWLLGAVLGVLRGCAFFCRFLVGIRRVGAF